VAEAAVATGIPPRELEADPVYLEAILDVLDEQARQAKQGGSVLGRLKAKLGVVD
jgi:hypothetical protein